VTIEGGDLRVNSGGERVLRCFYQELTNSSRSSLTPKAVTLSSRRGRIWGYTQLRGNTKIRHHAYCCKRHKHSVRIFPIVGENEVLHYGPNGLESMFSIDAAPQR